MCESNAYVEKDGGQDLLLENVGRLVFEGDTILLEGILGDQVRIRGSVKEIDFMSHRIVLRKNE